MYVEDFLRTRSVWFQTFLHRPASSAAKAAANAHLPGRTVAKSVLVKAGDDFVLAVLPATSRVDLERLGMAMGLPAQRVRLADASEVESVFLDCEPGTIPPFGRLYGLRTALDASLAANPEITFRGNLRHQGLRMHLTDYVALAEPHLADFGQPIRPQTTEVPSRRRHRRAG